MTSDDPAAGGSNLSFGYCRCLPGYVGDASDLDIGCVLGAWRDFIAGFRTVGCVEDSFSGGFFHHFFVFDLQSSN